MDLILTDVLAGLQTHMQCIVPVDKAHTLFLKLFPTLPAPVDVAPHQVPVLVCPLPASVLQHWDLTLQLVVPHINGVNYVARIASTAHVALPLVRKALQLLLYVGRISLIDVFQ